MNAVQPAGVKSARAPPPEALEVALAKVQRPHNRLLDDADSLVYIRRRSLS